MRFRFNATTRAAHKRDGDPEKWVWMKCVTCGKKVRKVKKRYARHSQAEHYSCWIARGNRPQPTGNQTPASNVQDLSILRRLGIGMY